LCNNRKSRAARVEEPAKSLLSYTDEPGIGSIKPGQKATAGSKEATHLFGAMRPSDGCAV